jgi:16S rRNA (cytosine967-C5)-methyltransferase
MLGAAQSHPPLTLRVNCRKGSVDGYAAELAGLGVDARIVGESAVEIPPRPVSEIPGFSEGRVSVQDAGAQHAAFVLGARPGERVLDACAAPGGKTGHLLELADLDLVAMDNDPERLRKVRSNLDRLGLEASLLCADAGRLEAWWDGRPFDRILLDAPCSASGVTRRHPDIRWGRQETDPRRFARQQLELLGSLWKALAIGGTLLYATCSLFEEENGQVVQDFLNRMHDAENVPIARRGVVGGYVRPDERHDGFFYALLRKAPVGVA